VTSEYSPSADICCVTEDLAAAAAAADGDGSALVINDSATEQFGLVDSVKTECSRPVVNTVTLDQRAPPGSCADDSVDAAKKRQLCIAVKRQLLPTAITPGNSLGLHCAYSY